jgi:hypothetical protein
MKTDVKAANVSATGVVYGARTRLRGALIVPGGSVGSVLIKDGASGATILSVTTLANGTPFSVVIPEDGVLVSTGLYATVSNATATVFYG